MSPNTRRLRRARAATNAYIVAYPDAQDGSLDQREVMVDLLADLAHLLYVKRIDPHDLFRQALVHFDAEKGGEE